MEHHNDVTAAQNGHLQTAKKRPVIGSAGSMFKEFTETCSLHGLWRATNSSFHIARRLLWFIAILLGLAMLLYSVIQQVLIYLEFRVQNLMSLQDNDQLEFPAITICNFNQFRKSLVSKKGSMADKLKILFPLPQNEDNNKENLLAGPPPFTKKDYQVRKQLLKLAHTFEDTIDVCFLNNRRVTCSKYFATTITEVGVCFTFNGMETRKKQKPVTVHDAGSDQGFLVRINIQNEEYYYGESTSAGVRVLIHDPHDVPLVRQKGFAASPGYTTVASVQVNKKILAKKPYGHCVDTHESTFVNPLQYYSNYSLNACKVEYRAEYIYNTCSCILFYDPGNRTICKTMKNIQCAKKAAEDYIEHQPAIVKKACIEPCETQTYSVKLSMAKFPGQHILDDLMFKYKVNETYIRKNYLQLLVYFEHMSTLVSEQVPAYSFTDLFSDVGGIMGMCVGASVLTLFELVEFPLLILFKKVPFTEMR